MGRSCKGAMCINPATPSEGLDVYVVGTEKELSACVHAQGWLFDRAHFLDGITPNRKTGFRCDTIIWCPTHLIPVLSIQGWSADYLSHVKLETSGY